MLSFTAMRTVFLETYGCQMNVADSEVMAGVLERAGMSLVDDPEDADAVVLNTCAIREHAEQRVLGRLGQLERLKQANPRLIVGVAGCMAQHMRKRLLDGHSRILDLVVGPDGYRNLPELLKRAAGEPVSELRLDRDETYGDLEPKREAGIRAWVTVQRGCDKFCTYCVVPYTRGRERSLTLIELVQQVRTAVSQGFREIVYLGQTVNSYRDGEHDFADLLRATQDIDGVLRIRYTSPHPSDMTQRVIDAMAECSKVCPQVHLPLQSASDKMLQAMNRTYDMARYRDVVAAIRGTIPGVALSTDVIVGFPGETDADYALTVEYMREERFDAAFLFKYSARPDTKAFSWPETVSEPEKSYRLARLIELQQECAAQRNDEWLGRDVEVLVEGTARKRPDQLYGRTPQFKAVVFPDDGSAAGTLRTVRVVGTTSNTLIAAPVPLAAERMAAPRLLSIG